MTSVSLLVLVLALAAPQTPSAHAEAERLANSGAHQEALKRFQAIVAANPSDVPARLWIGKLHLAMGHATRAAAVFESVVATSPQNVDALVGLGRALTEAGRGREAGDALSRAEALASARIDVLDAQGRYHASQGRSTLALAYYERALAAEPGNAAIRAAADALRAAQGHRLDVGYDVQSLGSGDGRMHAGGAEVNLRVNDALRAFGRAQIQSFDEANEARGGGGVEWTGRPGVWLRVGALFGADTEWLPGVDTFLDATFGVRRVRWTATVRFFDFEGADLWIAGPGVAIDLTERVTFEGRYLRGRTGLDVGDSTTSDSGTLALTARLTERARGTVAYHRGIDRLEWMTIDRITATSANTLAFDGAVDLTPFVGLSAGYDLQERPGDFRVHRGRVWLSVRF